ncbi:HesB/IscA family protein [Paraflavitalea pollutisoli]|uniref:HesB/IscA family protein n=1 Tax=Paraflavitalea pollutisoli TaxID=3034143 RepID=UPI0023EAE833|nr:iron-sulfur cluster assembly accessory protein [Paraflavitalea sp. H1-2-19X]
METVTAPVQFTPSARTELLRLMNDPGFDTSKFLRIGVKGGGCSGMSYVLGFDDRQEADQLYEVDGLRFIMNQSHGLYLAGIQIDWLEGLNARGFSFSNPNASKTCGCGSSFAV